GSVDLHAEPGSLDQTYGDPHPGFERAQLLETLTLLEDAARQPDKAFERRAAIGVKPDMFVMGSLAPRHRRLAEIERSRWAGRVDKAGDDLVDAGVGERGGVLDHGGEGRDIDFRIGEPSDCHLHR